MDLVDVNKRDTIKFKYIILFSMLYTITFISPVLLAYRQVQLGPLFLPGGTIFFASSFIFGDIVSEIYGYRIAKWMVIFALISQAILSIFVSIVIHLPTPKNWGFNSAYLLVFGHVIRYSAASMVGNILGEFSNIYLISKLRIILNGRYFWIRSIASSAVGELILTASVFSITFIHIPLAKPISHIILDGYIYKLCVSIILSLPSSFLVNYLKTLFIESPIIRLSVNPFSKNL